MFRREVRLTPVLRCAFESSRVRHGRLAFRPFVKIRPMSSLVKQHGPILDDSYTIEEERTRGYKAEEYYPVEIGQTFGARYKTVGKLGAGSASTVWLCRDLHDNQESYIALKVYTNRPRMHRELSICQEINRAVSSSELPGRNHVRKLLNSFEIEGPHSKHICLVFEALGNSLWELEILGDGAIKTQLIAQLMRPILGALKFLHTEAKIIHTDLQTNNILLGIHDRALLTKFEQDEVQEPSPRKVFDDRTIYLSRPIVPFAEGLPSLSDFSEARSGDTEHTDLAMPELYRAPEVILEMSWSFPVDVWAFAMVIWDLVERNRLFSPRDENGHYSEEHHLAQMVSIMGPPPLDFIQRSAKCEKYWDQNGDWIGSVPIPTRSLRTAEERLASSPDEQEAFLDFMQKMLRWKPEDRADWGDILLSEWLLADLIASGEVRPRND